MKEKFIQEITSTMAEFLDIEQLAALNGVLLQVVSNYTITSDEESQHDSSASNLRLLEMFLSAKQVEGCSIKTAKYYEVTIKQLFKKNAEKSGELHHRRHSRIPCGVSTQAQIEQSNYRQYTPYILVVLFLARRRRLHNQKPCPPYSQSENRSTSERSAF